MLTTIAILVCATQPEPLPSAPAPAELRYTVDVDDATGVDGVIPLHVSLRTAHPPARLVLDVPVWAPGSYRLREFPDRIHDVEAADSAGRALEVERLDRETWQVRTLGRATSVHYRVDLHDDDRFMLRGPKRRCVTYEGPAVYVRPRGFDDAPCHVHFSIPEGWSVASGLVDRGDGRFFAADYDVLVDCPVKLGVFQSWSFESWGKRIDVVLDGPGDIEFEHEAWLANIRTVTDAQGEIFGGLPFDRYVYLFTASSRGGGGGLEHLNSTTIGVAAGALRRNPRTGLSTVAHELFHAWNVKRIRPVELGPFDYSRPNRTTALWFMEGVTSYYTQVTLARCGLLDEDGFWDAMASQIQRLESNPARAHVSSADASRTVWDPSASDRTLNYYNSGLVLGLLLDVEIRARSENRRSLDDLVRALYRHCAMLGRGFTELELPQLASSVAESDLQEFFDRYVDGTCVPPYGEILAQAGVQLDIETSHEKELRGVRPVVRGDGVYWSDPDARSPHDVSRSQGLLTAVDGEPVASVEEVEAIVARSEVGVELRLDLESPIGVRRAKGVVVAMPRTRVSVELPDDVPAGALAIRSGIVTGVPRRAGR